MIKIRITWPALFLLAFIAFAWLIREPAPRKTSRPRRKTSHTLKRAGSRQRPFIIDQDGGDDAPDSDYDAETEDLDREVFEAARSAQRPSRPNPLRKEYTRDRANTAH